MNATARFKSLTNYPAAVAGVAATIVFAVAFYRYQLINPYSDISEHIKYARNMKSIVDITPPHFLFQIILNITRGVSGLSYEAAAVLCLALFYGAMALLIAEEVSRHAPHLSPTLRVTATIGVLLASHVFLQSVFTPNLYYGYVVPISYHNPTQQLSKLLAVAMVFIYCRSVLDQVSRPLLPTILLLGSGCILSAIAKPSFLIAFLPAAGFVALWHLRKGDWSRAAVFLAGIAIPSVIVLGLQFYWTYVAGPGATNAGIKIILAPFAAAARDASTMLLRLPASLFFPSIVAILALRLRTVTPRLCFAWLLVLIGLGESFLLAEAGPRIRDGNFFWTGQTVMFILYVESTLCLVAQEARRWRVGWGAFILHVVFGAVFFGAVILLPVSRYL